MLRESFLHRLDEVVGGGAGGLKLDQGGDHLPGERVLDKGGLVGVVVVEDLAEPFSLGFDTASATSPFEGGLELGVSQSSGSRGSWSQLEDFVGLKAPEAVLPGFERR